MICKNENMHRALLGLVIVLNYSFLNAQQLVLRGDYPDPSVIKIGTTYWASATTSNWMPAYPILKSKDLVNWKTVSHVFMKLPGWADYYFWAPELSYDNGKVYVYYAAHKKGGNLCVGVASAKTPEGPYTDHGPLICQEVGSIDAFPMRDENGKLYLVWKEDANSVGKPTPIWAQQLNEERTGLIGEKKELFRNNAAWEGNLVEGVSMIRHGDYFYTFYAGAGCCGRECSYGVGIARSKSLLGPWEKYSKNPALTKNEGWTCPGHGTPVDKNGKHYFMYHAYNKTTNVYTGREVLLNEYRFTSDGWIEFVNAKSFGEPAISNVKDDFSETALSNQWQWSVFQQPKYELKAGDLYLTASRNAAGNFVAQKTITGNYHATVKIQAKKSNASAGIGIIGDENNLIAALFENDSVRVIQTKNEKETVLSKKQITAGEKFYLRVNVSNANEVKFQYSFNGKAWNQLNDTPVDGSFLPPWDRAVRVGIISKGNSDTQAVFDAFELINESRAK